MKKKGKINPRDVPKTKFISEKRDKVARNNESFKNIESPSDFSKEFEEEKSPFKREENKKRQDYRDNRDNNYENSQDNTSYSQEKNQDLFKTGEKSNREKIQRKTQEKIYKEKAVESQEENPSINSEREEYHREERIKQENDRIYEDRISNYENNFNHVSTNNIKNTGKENFLHKDKIKSYDPLSQDSDNDGIIDRYDMNFRDSRVSYRDTRDDHKYLKKSNFEDSYKATILKTDRKRIEKFQKNHIGKEEIKEPSSYDPLSQDSDIDGVIDRYDMNFRDSRVSYRDTRDNHKYLPTSKDQRKNWEGISLFGNKRRDNFQKNKLKKLYQEEGQFKDKEKKTGLKSSSEKFRKKSLSYKANEEDKKTIQDLSFNKRKARKYFKDKATIPEEKEILDSRSSYSEFRQDSLSKGLKSEAKKDKEKYNLDIRKKEKRRLQEKTGKKKETIKEEKDIETNETLDEGKLDLKHSGSSNKDKTKKWQGKDTFEDKSKKSNFDPKEEYTRTKKEIKDTKEILEEKKIDGKKESKFHSKKDKKTGKDKFYKKEEKVSKLYEKKSKKEKDLIKDKKKAKKGGLEKPITLASAMTANYLYSGKEDNTGINAAYKLSRTTELASRKISHNRRKKPVKTQKKIKSLEGKIHKKESKLLFQRNFEEVKKTKAYQNTNRLNRFFMKKRFQRDFKKKQGESIRKRIKNTFTSLGKKSVEVIRKKGYKGLIIGLCFLGIFIMGFQAMSGMGGISSGLSSNVMATSYLSKEEVLSDVNNEFSSYEYALQDEIDSIKTNYPNYDEYHIKGDSVGHDVHELFSYLTARYGEIKSVGEIQGELKKLFNQMYEKKYTSKSMTKYDSEGNPYTYRILTLTITKKSIDEVAREEFANYETNMAHYLALLENQGNMSGTFGSGYGDLGEIIDNPNFGNPGIEFDDASVKRLFGEAEKHIGKRYVFGASGPSNFDCSGFVCWSFSKSGVKRMPRTTAWLIYKNYCNPISPSEAKPGDIIFFKGTYNSGTPISHVGIYAGNGMMLHAGDPIQYTSINSKYWKSHFYSFGRPK